MTRRRASQFREDTRNCARCPHSKSFPKRRSAGWAPRCLASSTLVRVHVSSLETARGSPETPWLVDEALGGWLGRVAAVYRMSVSDLALSCGMSSCPDSCRSWLLTAGVSEASMTRLADLARVEARSIRSIEPPPGWCCRRSHVPYCPACLFLNPLDVSSPRWVLRWLQPGVQACDAHGSRLHWISRGQLDHCRNFSSLLSLISRLERKLLVQQAV
jgi:hypothetical protein